MATFGATPQAVSGLQLAFWLLCILALVAILLQFGVWRKEINVSGPFASEVNPPQHSFILTVPSEGSVQWWRQPLIGDSAEKPFESKLRLRIEGREIWPAHSDPVLIREGRTPGYSHRGSDVVFSLPAGVENGPKAKVTLWYKIRPRPWIPVALVLSLLGSGVVLYFGTIRSLVKHSYSRIAIPVSRHVGCWAPSLLAAPHVMLFSISFMCLLGTVIFLGSSLYAWMTGWALPTTALIRWSSWAEWAARNELHFGYLLLSLSGLGIVASWAASLIGYREAASSHEVRLKAFLAWAGFPIILGAFLLNASAMWDGMVRPGDAHWANIGGLIPYNDAHGHQAEAFFQANTGSWTSFALRRPLAAAFRSVLLLSAGYSFPVMLAIQICLVAFASFIAACWVIKWRGIWAGVAFLGLTYIYTRIFLPTSLTEPLGLFWSLLSIPFFVETFRSESVKPALVGFAMTSVGLMIRMGSMFTIPSLLLWLVWQFGRSAREKIAIAIVAAAILIGVAGVNSFLSRIYGIGGAETGSNFSYVVCGLSIGTTWDGCQAKLAKEGEALHGNEAEVAQQLYSYAWKNFKENPSIFYNRLVAGVKYFLTTFPKVMWKGYGVAIDTPIWLFQSTLSLVGIIGLCFTARYGMSRTELSFWGLLWASIIVSSALIYFDDGPRTLAVSQPLIALFFAAGISSEAVRSRLSPVDRRLLSGGALVLVIAGVGFVTGPWISHYVWSLNERHFFQYSEGDAYVSGGRRISGFLVVADSEKLNAGTPSIHFSDFEAIIAQSGVEPTLPVLHPKAPATPFAFLYAPRLEAGGLISGIFVTPPSVLEYPEIFAWKFEVAEGARPGAFRLNVTKAVPWR